MKISKLFHWLYGFVMLLPIFAIGSACLISTFNMASKEQAEIVYKYETNDVNSVNDIKIGNIYKVNLEEYEVPNVNIGVLNASEIYVDNKSFNIDYLNDSDSYMRLQFNSNGSIVIVGYVNGAYYNTLYNQNVSDLDNLYFVYLNLNGLSSNGIETYYSIFEESDYNVPLSFETYNINAQDVFYDSVEKVQNMPIFSWSYNSFLVTPFQYILVLFGVPSNHVVVELLSYWLSISIIWLVFDVIMYVPLLVHRWLDKGVLE